VEDEGYPGAGDTLTGPGPIGTLLEAPAPVQASVGEVLIADYESIEQGEPVPPVMPRISLTPALSVSTDDSEGSTAPTPALGIEPVRRRSPSGTTLPPPPPVPAIADGAAGTAGAAAIPLAVALRQPVLVSGTPVPMWILAAAPLATACLLLGTAVLILALRDDPAPVAPVPGGTTVTGESQPPTTGGVTPSPDDGNWKALAARPATERSIKETLAVFNGQRQAAEREVAELGARIGADPKLARDPKIMAKLRTAAADPTTSSAALAAIAAIPGETSADVLYLFSLTGKGDSGKLAKELLQSPEVRAKSSPALLLALELAEVTDCEKAKALIARATEQGDHRALPQLARMQRKTGCGATKREDCFACLRDDDPLTPAVKAVRKRPPPIR
jgi:hypothetical protein